MSLVMGILTHDNHLILVADKRAKKDGIINDNFSKIFCLRENLYFGITGIAEYGLAVKDVLEPYLNCSIEEIIRFADSIYTTNETSSTIMICGKKPNNISFVWSKNSKGEVVYMETSIGNVSYTINTSINIKLIDLKFIEEIKSSSVDYDLAIKNTFEYASTIDNSISSTYELFKIWFREQINPSPSLLKDL